MQITANAFACASFDQYWTIEQISQLEHNVKTTALMKLLPYVRAEYGLDDTISVRVRLCGETPNK